MAGIATGNLTVPPDTSKQSNTLEKGIEGATSDPTQILSPENNLTPAQLAQMARRERMVRQKEREFQAKQQAWQAEQEAKKADFESALALRQRYEQNPLDLFAESIQQGKMSGDQLTQYLLNQPKPEFQEMQALKAELKAIKAEIEAGKQSQEKNQASQMEAAEREALDEITGLIATDPQYETIKALGAEKSVWQLIKQNWEETGKVMGYAQAATEVEDYLMEKSLELAKLKKIQEKLSLPKEEPAQKLPENSQKAATQAAMAAMTTLSNRQAPPSPPAHSKLNAKEARDRAIKRFLGQLQE